MSPSHELVQKVAQDPEFARQPLRITLSTSSYPVPMGGASVDVDIPKKPDPKFSAVHKFEHKSEQTVFVVAIGTLISSDQEGKTTHGYYKYLIKEINPATRVIHMHFEGTDPDHQYRTARTVNSCQTFLIKGPDKSGVAAPSDAILMKVFLNSTSSNLPQIEVESEPKPYGDAELDATLNTWTWDVEDEKELQVATRGWFDSCTIA